METIKPQELRIGNFVIFYETIIELDGVTDSYITCKEPLDVIDPKDVKGIALTTEWLERLGFVFRSGRWIVIDGNLTLKAKESTGGFKMMINSTHLRKASYVHQLQNLYFALTGQELTQI